VLAITASNVAKPTAMPIGIKASQRWRGGRPEGAGV
jgi:hypothetical protein